MGKFLLAALLTAALAQGAPAAASGPLNPVQQQKLGCVATLAIVASEQARGVASEWPALGERGARYAQVVGETLIYEVGWTKEAIRDAIITAVAERQKRASANGTSRDLPREEVAGCVALMDEIAPPPAPPGLPQCAAMVSLAYGEVHGREGLSNAAKDLATIASVLDYRAREALRGAGKSGTEIDEEMTLTRETIAAEAKRREAGGVSAGLDYGACFELAKP